MQTTGGRAFKAAASGVAVIPPPKQRLPAKAPATDDASAQSATRTHHCRKCSYWFARREGYLVGNGAAFTCKMCNNLEGRMRTIRTNSPNQFSSEWGAVAGDDMVEFMRNAKDLKGNVLADAMTATVRMVKQRYEDVYSAGEGSYFPENYYLDVMKFTPAQVAGIVKNCPNKFDEVLGCQVYNYSINKEGWKHGEHLSTQATYKPAQARKRKLDRKLSAPSSSQSSTSQNSSSDAPQPKPRSTSRRNKRRKCVSASSPSAEDESAEATKKLREKTSNPQRALVENTKQMPWERAQSLGISRNTASASSQQQGPSKKN